MTASQPGILASVPGHARYLEFVLLPDCNPLPVLRALADMEMDEGLVLGLGPALLQQLGGKPDGLRAFPAMQGPGCNVPSTQTDLWCWIRGEDRGQITHRARELLAMTEGAFALSQCLDGFRFERGLDLTGYEDGTENPEGEEAVTAAIVGDGPQGMAGSSFVAVQQWVHDLDHFQSLAQGEQDHIIGRRLSDNEELDDAPPSAHVKRTAQESFEPEAFVLRRSMPWADGGGEGLVFVAFTRTLDTFEAQLNRMTGGEDGIVDALFRFSRPASGSYFWCPPLRDGRLDLRAIGL